MEKSDVDFGTYHHSTPDESSEIRLSAEQSVTKLLRPLYPSGARLRILDAGCGLGFLTYVAAKCFPKACITDVDLFRHSSMSAMSIDKAANNMRFLGIVSRTSFLKHALTKPMESDGQYDLVVPILCFTTWEKRDSRAMARFSTCLDPKSFSAGFRTSCRGKLRADRFR